MLKTHKKLSHAGEIKTWSSVPVEVETDKYANIQIKQEISLEIFDVLD